MGKAFRDNISEREKEIIMNYKPWINSGASIMIIFFISLTAHTITYGFPLVAKTIVVALVDLTHVIGMLTGGVMVTIGLSLKRKDTTNE